jgi:predicted MPP superfamily phosphohydrolase
VLSALRRRIGDAHLEQRLTAQKDHARWRRGRGRVHLENFGALIRAVHVALRVTGLAAWGRRNALALTVRQNTIALPSLPPAFAGLRILHLSDLHFDGFPGFGQHIARTIAGHPFDLAVITGDYRFRTHGEYTHLASELAALAPVLACRLGAFGILGNHDLIEMVPMIERAGVRLLLNEAIRLGQDGAAVWLVGLDDPHYFGLHDFDRALRGVPADAFRVLLVHSPELLPEAAAHGFSLYLTGHTHGGQICLPGGYAPYMNIRCHPDLISGAWRYGAMRGYTSAGVGASGVFARFFCPPEIVIHTLTVYSGVEEAGR